MYYCYLLQVSLLDFQEAIAKYEVVTQNLEFARDLQKQFQVIGNDVSLSHFSDYVNFSLTDTRAHTHPFNGPLSAITQMSRYQKGKTRLDFTVARDGEWQWHQLAVFCISYCTFNRSIRYDTKCFFNVPLKADMSQLNLPHRNEN